MNIKPLGNRVLIKPVKREEMRGGIVLPDSADKEKKEQGEVVSVGAGDDVMKLGLKIGDKVLFGKYAGEEVKVDEQEYRFLNHDDVLAIVE